MLPFLDPKKTVSIIIAKRGKDELKDVKPETSDLDPGLIEAAEDILRAIDSRSVVDLAKALHSAFEVSESLPHVEGEHIEEE